MCKPIKSIDCGLSATNSAIFDKSGQKIVIGGEDGSIKVYNVISGESEGECKGHEDAVLDLTWDNAKEPTLLSASADCSFKIW